MEPTSLFRMGALALSASALAFVVWTAAAPGCATTEVKPDPADSQKSSASPGDTNEPTPGARDSNYRAEDDPLAQPAPTLSVVPPRFMGASKAAAPFDEDHLPGKKGAAPKQAPQLQEQKGSK